MIVFVAVTLLGSCSTNEGCTDPKAVNFESDADEDCHCCIYEGSMVIWYGEETADFLIAAQVSDLTYYIDGVISGSWKASLYYSSPSGPNCGDNGSVSIKKSLGESKSKAYTYKAVGNDGVTYWEGVINLEADKCIKLKLRI